MFEDGVHFLSFETREDLIDKINFIQENPIMAESIAIAGHKKYLEMFGNNKFWPDFFND
jgi:hypothetical protein